MAALEHIQWPQHMSSYLSEDTALDEWLGANQLKMFERAGVLAASPSYEQSPWTPKAKFIERKLEESHRQAFFPHETPSVRSLRPEERGVVNSTYESIQQHGVRNPVMVEQRDNGSYMLHHGHHRVYSAADIDPDMLVPLVHIESPSDPNRQTAARQSTGYEGWHDPTTPPKKD